MPNDQKMALQGMMQKLPLPKQEQLIAEIVATHARRKEMSNEERMAEDMEIKSVQQQFQAMMQTMDPMQQQILRGQMGGQNFLPSAQLAFMKKIVNGGAGVPMPPTAEEVKDWKALYLSYFDANLSVKKGRMMPLEYCVRNPRPDEVMEALKSIQIRAIFEPVSIKIFSNLISLIVKAKALRCRGKRSGQVPAL